MKSFESRTDVLQVLKLKRTARRYHKGSNLGFINKISQAWAPGTATKLWPEHVNRLNGHVHCTNLGVSGAGSSRRKMEKPMLVKALGCQMRHRKSHMEDLARATTVKHSRLHDKPSRPHAILTPYQQTVKPSSKDRPADAHRASLDDCSTFCSRRKH